MLAVRSVKRMKQARRRLYEPISIQIWGCLTLNETFFHQIKLCPPLQSSLLCFPQMISVSGVENLPLFKSVFSIWALVHRLLMTLLKPLLQGSE